MEKCLIYLDIKVYCLFDRIVIIKNNDEDVIKKKYIYNFCLDEN